MTGGRGGPQGEPPQPVSVLRPRGLGNRRKEAFRPSSVKRPPSWRSEGSATNAMRPPEPRTGQDPVCSLNGRNYPPRQRGGGGENPRCRPLLPRGTISPPLPTRPFRASGNSARAGRYIHVSRPSKAHISISLSAWCSPADLGIADDLPEFLIEVHAEIHLRETSRFLHG